MRAELVHRPIDVSAIISEVAVRANGGVSVFVGIVRDTNEGRAVDGLEYTAYEPMAKRELRVVVAEAVQQFDIDAIVVEHRLGALEVGEVSVVAAAGHLRRANAMDATRYVISELKRRVPIWKREAYTDGTREWVDPTRSSPLSEATA